MASQSDNADRISTSSDDDVSEGYDIIVKFQSAEQLVKKFLTRRLHTYFVATIDNLVSYRSAVISNTTSPRWDDDEWIVLNVPPHAELVIKLFDMNDKKPADTSIGEFTIRHLIDYTPPAEGHSIIGKSGQSKGSFYLSIQSMKSSEQTKRLPHYTLDSACRYYCHNSLSVGLLTKISVYRTYSCWKIRMRRVSVFFPPYNRQYWSREHRAAKRIFGKHLVSTASRNSIQMAYKTLFESASRHNEIGSLNGAYDLWNFIFQDRTVRRIKPCVYAYVIDESSWKFNETSAQLFTDMASKHVLLSNCSEYVCYAGEFHPRPKYGWDRLDDEWELVFDNGSYTYTPSASLLKNLKELLLFNFPGLNIVTYDRRDPELRESLEQLRLAAKNS